MSADDKERFVVEGREAFVAAAMEMGLPCTEKIVSFVESWFRFYGSWNGRRVVGFENAGDMAVKLIADSFAIADYVPELERAQHLSVIDLGSGNGWPGLAVKALCPEIRLTLLDSRLGACEFLDGYLRSASLKGAAVAPFRAEEVSMKAEYKGRFDLVTTRAMAHIGVAIELAVPFLAKGGLVALWIGPEQSGAVESKAEIQELGLLRADIHEYMLPKGTGRRFLAVFRRHGVLQKGYPRSISSIKARPLL